MVRIRARRIFVFLAPAALLGFVVYWAYAHSNGITGQTLKSSPTAGCGAKVTGGGSCHGTGATSSVVVRITGPRILAVGKAGSFTFSDSGAAGLGGGFDIAAGNGILSSTSSSAQVLSQELTHNRGVAVPFTIDFSLTSSVAGLDTIFANGKGSSFSAWNWSPNFILRVGPPPAPVPDSPLAKSIGVSLTPKLVWSGISGPRWTVEVATDSAFTAPAIHQVVAGDTTYRVPPGKLAVNTLYYWHVSATDTGGTSAYSKPTWNFMTLVAPPPAPLQIFPANNATDVSTSPVLRWHGNSTASRYEVQFLKDSTFASVVTFDWSGIADTMFAPGFLLNGVKFFWRVRGINAAGTGDWSSVWSFTTQALNRLVIAKTGNGSGRVKVNDTVYTLPFSRDYAAAPNVSLTALPDSGSTFTGWGGDLSGSANPTTVIMVTTRNIQASFSLVSPQTRPAPPALHRPDNGAANLPLPVSFVWSAVQNALGYRLQIFSDQQLTRPALDDSALVDTIATADSLAPGNTYYWCVLARNAGSWSDRSEIRTFQTAKTSGLPGVPLLVDPVAGASQVPVNTVLKWQSVLGASSYSYQLSTDSSFSANVKGQDKILDTSFAISGLNYGTRYFWHVSATNVLGTSGWSLRGSFTTVAINALTISKTGNGSGRIKVGDTTYSLPFNRTYVSSTSVTLMALPDSGSLFANWGGDLTGNTNPATVTMTSVRNIQANFSLVPAPAAPAALSASGVVSTGFVAAWTSVAGATGYRLDVSTDTLFRTYVGTFNQFSVGNVTQYQVVSLSSGTVYYYRVRAENAGGVGTPSNVIGVRTYVDNFTVSQAFTFASMTALSDFSSTDYQLIGFPGNSGSDVGTLLPGKWREDWEVYWDNGKLGTVQDYYVEYQQNAPNFAASTGKAFWVLSRKNFSVSGSFSAPLLVGEGEASIPLTQGQIWNLITNPFDKTISWPAVAARNNIPHAQLQAYGSGWTTVQEMQPYQGYLFTNDQSLPALYIPYRLTAPGLGKTGTTEEPGSWRIQVTAISGKVHDKTTSFGVSPTASEGFDSFEQYKPRHFKDIPDVFFSKPEWNKRSNEFATDIRPAVGELAVWEMLVRSDNLTTVDLEFSGVENVPEGLAIVLVDHPHARIADLRDKQQYAFVPPAAVSTVRILVGKKDKVMAMAATFLPERFALEQNYPNPFNPSTTIPLVVPRESRVTVEIFSVLGQHVRTLFTGIMETGRQFLKWDGRDDGGRPLASGLYICRLQTDGTVRGIRKLTLIK